MHNSLYGRLDFPVIVALEQRPKVVDFARVVSIVCDHDLDNRPQGIGLAPRQGPFAVELIVGESANRGNPAAVPFLQPVDHFRVGALPPGNKGFVG